jgi:hypothetical protein
MDEMRKATEVFRSVLNALRTVTTTAAADKDVK